MKQVNHKQMVEAIIAGKPLVVEIFAPNCAPCQIAQRTLEVLAQKHEGLSVVKIELRDVEQGFLRLRNIRSAPTCIAFSYGVELGRVTGGEPERIQRLVNNMMDEINADSGEEITHCESCQ